MNTKTEESVVINDRMASSRNINILVLIILSPILILLGVFGYFMPAHIGFVCTDPYYNLFHIDAGIIGIIIFLSSSITLARIYNIFLGMIYVYQAAASFFHIFPAKLLHYTIADDIMNIDIGAVLLLIGLMANNVMEAKKEKP